MTSFKLHSSGTAPRTLVVEDNAMIALDIESMLLTNGIDTVLLAKTLREATEHVKDILPNLAILDFSLPEGTSLEFARTLTARAVPMVFVSGLAERVSLPQDLMNVPIVEKPFTQDALFSAIQAAIAALPAAAAHAVAPAAMEAPPH